MFVGLFGFFVAQVLTVFIMLFLQCTLLVGYTLSGLGDSTLTLVTDTAQDPYYVHSCVDVDNDRYKIFLTCQLVFIGIFLMVGLYIAFGVRHVPSAFNGKHPTTSQTHQVQPFSKHARTRTHVPDVVSVWLILVIESSHIVHALYSIIMLGIILIPLNFIVKVMT